MFIGHYGVAFGLKRYQKGISLGLLFLAVMLQDIIWSILILLGAEKVAIVPGITKANPLDLVKYPYSHSLLSTMILMALVFMIVPLFLNHKSAIRKTAIILAVAICSHYLLDFIVHRPDLPILFGDTPKIGMGLWNRVFLAYFVETVIFIAGFLVYIRSMNSLSTGKKIGMSLFALALLGLFFLGLTGAVPPSPTVLAVSSLIYNVVFIGIAIWLDWVGKAYHSVATPEIQRR